MHRVLAVLVVAVVATGCASTRPAPVGSRGRPSRSGESGLISFYHDGLSGNLMANGKPYNPDNAVCAHKSLPFGTKLEVRIEGGGEAACTVSDRGPFVRGRILDVSKSVARELGLVQRGVARGSIAVVP